MTPMNAHTPGPWRRAEQYDPETGTVTPCHTPYIVDAQGRNVAAVLLGEPVADEEIVANARLIAAAPDLLAALEAILQPSHTPATYDAAIEQARAAIAKAKGDA